MRSHKNPIQQVRSHWRPAAYGGGDDNSTGECEEKQALVAPSTPPRHTPQNTLHNGTSRATRVWDVKMPPVQKHMVHGLLVPTVGGTIGSRLMQKTRRISVEIHTEEDEMLLGVSDSPTRGGQVMSGLLRGDSRRMMEDSEVLHEGERVFVRILKPADQQDDHDDDSTSEGMHVDALRYKSSHRLLILKSRISLSCETLQATPPLYPP